MKYTSVRVVSGGGSPEAGARVSIYVSQFAASGSVDDQYTDSNGEADFSLDIDDGAEITVYVNGQERIGRGAVRSNYTVSI